MSADQESAKLVALAKRAFERQLQDAGSSKRQAERLSRAMTHPQRWKALPLLTRLGLRLEAR